VGDPNPNKAENKGVNPKMKHNQFADFHGHGWVYRKVYKKDRHGYLLDKDDKPITEKPLKDKDGNLVMEPTASRFRTRRLQGRPMWARTNGVKPST